jgi:hypothetical protein
MVIDRPPMGTEFFASDSVESDLNFIKEVFRLTEESRGVRLGNYRRDSKFVWVAEVVG